MSISCTLPFHVKATMLAQLHPNSRKVPKIRHFSYLIVTKQDRGAGDFSNMTKIEGLHIEVVYTICNSCPLYSKPVAEYQDQLQFQRVQDTNK